ncbi:hypothetical protein Sango_1590500 [Sesamum angolense]|uniref:Retrotransposon gag protein n=1 Tax=Sesamum angolense TaxID=2727404 RepID=A0AAE1WQA1_9LAMI|nr:hypothetical protein Sango_1590500 [Sesamum angolense]
MDTQGKAMKSVNFKLTISKSSSSSTKSVGVTTRSMSKKLKESSQMSPHDEYVEKNLYSPSYAGESDANKSPPSSPRSESSYSFTTNVAPEQDAQIARLINKTDNVEASYIMGKQVEAHDEVKASPKQHYTEKHKSSKQRFNGNKHWAIQAQKHCKDNVGPRNNVPYERPQKKLTLKGTQVREYPFLDSNVLGIFDDLLEANLIDLPEMKRPEEAERKDDPKYYKYHRLVGHAIHDCFVFKDKVMQLARQGKNSLEEDSAVTNAITFESGHVNVNKDSCNAMHGDNITSNEDILFEKEDSSDADNCMSTITFSDEDLLLGSKPHNRSLFVAGY